MGKIPKLAGSEFEKERRGDQAFFSVTVIRDSLTDWIIFFFYFSYQEDKGNHFREEFDGEVL